MCLWIRSISGSGLGFWPSRPTMYTTCQVTWPRRGPSIGTVSWSSSSTCRFGIAPSFLRWLCRWLYSAWFFSRPIGQTRASAHPSAFRPEQAPAGISPAFPHISFLALCSRLGSCGAGREGKDDRCVQMGSDLLLLRAPTASVPTWGSISGPLSSFGGFFFSVSLYVIRNV